MLLAELGPGEKFKVMRVVFGGEIGKRLADLGFISGAEGEVVRAGLFRGPMQVRLGDYDLIMRRHEARLVEVELLPQTATKKSAHGVRAHIDLRPHFRAGGSIHPGHGVGPHRPASGKKPRGCH